MKWYSAFIALAVCCFAGAVRATPIVTYTLAIDSNGPGTFSVFADDSVGDNAGLASYAVSLFNISTVTNMAPKVIYDDGVGGDTNAGFTLFRSTNGSALDPTKDPVTGSQDTVGAAGPAIIIYGFGQSADNFAAHDPNKPNGSELGLVQNSWAAHLLLITGTYAVGGPAPQFGPGPSTAQVFVSNTSTDSVSATVVTQVPEPSLGILLLAGALGVGASRRR
jgi:hypothetical protein